MTLQACDEITETLPSSFRSNQECVAQGLANLLCGVFGAMGGDAMIGQSTINIMNGARGRLSGATAGVMMLIFIVALSRTIELVPIGTLTGVLFMVVLNTFNWCEKRESRSVNREARIEKRVPVPPPPTAVRARGGRRSHRRRHSRAHTAPPRRHSVVPRAPRDDDDPSPRRAPT